MTGLLAAAPAHAADYSGGRAFFTTPIASGAPLDARSSQWIGGLGRSTPYLNGPDNRFAPPVYPVTSQTPLRTVRCKFCGAYTGGGGTDYADTVQVPIPDNAVPDPSADGHLALVDAERGQEWNLFQASRNSDGSWNAGGAGHFNLKGDGHQDNVLGGGSATASHLPLSQAISVPEVLTAITDGSYLIPHALSFGAPNVDGRCWVYPALGSDGGTAGGLPEGARIQLDPSLDVSMLLPAARVIARTLQVYGAYLRDQSGAFVFYLRESRGADLPWTAAAVTGDSLSGVPTDRFRVLSADFTTLGTSQPFVQRPAATCGPGATSVEPDRSADGRPGPPVTVTGSGSSAGTGTGTASSSGSSGGKTGSDPVASSDDDDRVTGSSSSAATAVKKPKAPVSLRVKLAGGKAQLVWNSTEKGRRYRVYVNGRLLSTTTRTYTGQLRLKRGRNRAYVQAVSVGGVLGGKTATITFKL
ncbi:hypothetical protein [Paraconexibacter sp. AEG42_29]|uniref:hypothetical protein n=1 Tax=Paraconexibacter sp. AEG42_29 TaxID=2997339 RepID=UPI00339D7AFE